MPANYTVERLAQERPAAGGVRRGGHRGLDRLRHGAADHGMLLIARN